MSDVYAVTKTTNPLYDLQASFQDSLAEPVDHRRNHLLYLFTAITISFINNRLV